MNNKNNNKKFVNKIDNIKTSNFFLFPQNKKKLMIKDKVIIEILIIIIQ